MFNHALSQSCEHIKHNMSNFKLLDIERCASEEACPNGVDYEIPHIFDGLSRKLDLQITMMMEVSTRVQASLIRSEVRAIVWNKN